MTTQTQASTQAPAQPQEQEQPTKHAQPEWGVTFPDQEQVARYKRPSLEKACYGNDRMASVLNYFLFEGSWELKRQKLPKGCKVVTFTRTHKDIRDRLTFNLSRKSLIGYLDTFNEWGYVNSEKYQRTFTVHFDTVQQAIDTPPAPKEPKERKPRAKKGCNVEEGKPFEHNEDLAKKVEELQHNVNLLYKKVEELQPLAAIGCNMLHLQPVLTALVETLQRHFPEDSILFSITDLHSSIREYAGSSEPANAPTSLSEFAEKKRITNNRIPAVKPDVTETETQYHIAKLATVTTDTSTVDTTAPLDGDVEPDGYMTSDDPESEDFDPDTYEREVIGAFLGAPRLTLPSKIPSQQGVGHANDTLVAPHLPADRDIPPVVPGSGLSSNDGVQQPGRSERQAEVPADTQGDRQADTALQVQQEQAQEIIPEQAPDLQAHMSRPLAIPPGESASLLLQSSVARDSFPQISTLPTSTDVPPSVQQSPGDAAPVAHPPDGSPVSSGAVQASGVKKRRNPIPERPKDKKVIQMPAVPKFTLTEQEQAFWTLWCGVWFNKDIPPDLNDTAYGHVVKLAPHITTPEQIESLVKHARKVLEENFGVKRKVVHLGNCVNAYPDWKQTQEPPPVQDGKPYEETREFSNGLKYFDFEQLGKRFAQG